MNGLVFILACGVKNGFFELLRKPAKLILYLVVVAVMVLVLLIPMLTGSVDAAEGREYTDMFWLKGIFFAFVLLFAILSVQKGLTAGDSIFEMNDVNLLFVSPVSPKATLIYGLARLTKTAFLSGFFILFQGGSLGNGFGIRLGGLLTLLLMFMLSVMFLSILSIVIYSVTNGRPGRKRAVRVIAVLAFCPPIIIAAMQFAGTGNALAALEAAIKSPMLTWVPAAGWSAEGAYALLTGDVTAGLVFIGVIVLASALLVAYIALSRSDYYEDVLVATETAFVKKRAAQEGNINAASGSAKKVRVAGTGIGGWGARAVLYKHLRESFRENRFGFLNIVSVLFIAGSAALAFFLPKGVDSLMIMQILMWAQIMLIGTGRGLRELYSHYIYLIPEPPFAKIVWSNLELVFRTLMESVLIFGITGAILGDSFWVIGGVITCYSLFSLLLIGLNYLSMRWTSADISKGLLIMIYYFSVIVIMLPGVIPAVILGSAAQGNAGLLLGLGILSAWELAAALGCFALARGVLHNSDMPSAKLGK